jgi:hypothetical protein
VGHFLTVTAVRSEDFGQVLEAVTRHFEAHGVAVSQPRRDSPSPAVVSLYEPTGGWTTIGWPEFFNTKDAAAARGLSRELATVVSAMGIYSSDTWLHHVYRDGELVDRFAKDPDALAANRAERRSARIEWSGDSRAVAEAFGVPVETVAPYYRHAADPDEWEFVQLWARLGITYPVSSEHRLPVWATLVPDDSWQRLLPSEG